MIDARLSCLSLGVGAPGWPGNRGPAGVQGPRSLDLAALTYPDPVSPGQGDQTGRSPPPLTVTAQSWAWGLN